MKTRLVLFALVFVLGAAATAPAGFELRTWTTPAAAPATGDPTCTSTSFVMRSRLGGPFAGYAESTSFSLWGCSAYTPVEGAFFAVLEGELSVVLRWTTESLAGIEGFNVYRALAEEGPFEKINAELLPPESPGLYVDQAVWPGTWFWYELRAVRGGSEEPVGQGPVSVKTGGTLETKLFAVSPNPFRGETVLHLDLASERGAKLVIYDVSGRVVRTFNRGFDRPGRYSVTWDGRNDAGERVASGVYFCALEADGKRDARSIVLLK